MAELLWSRETPDERGLIAAYNCGGGQVMICGDMIRESVPGAPPGWAQVAGELAGKRLMEYQAETGHWPTRELFAAWHAAMMARLERFLDEPAKNPFVPETMREWEVKNRGICHRVCGGCGADPVGQRTGDAGGACPAGNH